VAGSSNKNVVNGLLRAAVVVVATKRLTELIISDEITAPLRYRLDSWAFGKEMYSLPERVSYAAGCVRCSSIWAAGAVLAMEATRPGRFLVNVLATSHVVIAVSGKESA